MSDNEKKIAFNVCKAAEIDGDERTVIGVISSSAIDRDKEVLLPKGVKLENYLKNPVVLWAHKSDQLPIGKTLWLRVFKDSIKAKVKFANTAMANDVFNLFRGGFLNAFSVGFLPLKGRQPTPDDIKSNPALADARYIYDEWELLEFSPVPVPSNPTALVSAVKSKQFEFADKTFGDTLLAEYAAQDEKAAQISEMDSQEEGELYIPVSELTGSGKTDEKKSFAFTRMKLPISAVMLGAANARRY